ncbi:unnamed protein product [Blepharisma stoltei]|uniref:Uncharacterized protein n=1 Tax=Blepharisma stoltei TaxID=1481888 RepID=A0AAU9K164_9CILI|nr:unnamed protein product [Blepharisma stoltei]
MQKMWKELSLKQNPHKNYPPNSENRREFLYQETHPNFNSYQTYREEARYPRIQTYKQDPATFMPDLPQKESQISVVKCSSNWCNKNATAWCRCKNQYLHFCAEDLENHIINSPGNHNFQKLLDGSNIQTNSDFLLYMQYKMQLLRDLKEKLVNKIYAEICKLENSLMTFIEKIDQEIASFALKFSQTTQELESCYWYKNDDYFNQLPDEVFEFIKENQKTSISEASCETIISEIYKELGWVKNAGFQEISSKNEYEMTNPRFQPDLKTSNSLNLRQQYQQPYAFPQYNQIITPQQYQQPFKPYEDRQPRINPYDNTKTYSSIRETATFKSEWI